MFAICLFSPSETINSKDTKAETYRQTDDRMNALTINVAKQTEVYRPRETVNEQ